MEEGVPIESQMISKRIEGAQKAVEAQNFESAQTSAGIRRRDEQAARGCLRPAAAAARRRRTAGADSRGLRRRNSERLCSMSLPARRVRPDQWDLKGLGEKLVDHFGLNLDGVGHQAGGAEPARAGRGDLCQADRRRTRRRKRFWARPTMRYHERMVMLSVIDGLWKDHLLSMDHLKEGISLRGYAQQDPLVEYKRESFDMFEAMMLKFQEDTVRFLFRMQILGPDGQPVDAAPRPRGPVPKAPPVASAAQPMTRRWRAAGDRDSDAAAFDDDRRAREGVPPQEGARAGGGQPAGRRRCTASRRSGGPATRWAATIPAPAAAARNTRSATGWSSSDAPRQFKASERARGQRILPGSMVISAQEAEEASFSFFSASRPAAALAICADGLRDFGIRHDHGSGGFARSARGRIVVGNLPIARAG